MLVYAQISNTINIIIYYAIYKLYWFILNITVYYYRTVHINLT